MGRARPDPPQPVQPTFGVLLRQYRLAAGLTQEALAGRAGLSAQGLSALENGRRQAPHRHTIALLARAMGLSDAETATLGAAVVRVRAPAPATAPAPAGLDQETSAAGEADASPPVRAPQATRNNLPAQLTSFVGRERELDDVRALLGAARLVTLTGAGGAGKTRLALAVAGAVLHEYPDGVWLVELAPLADPALIVQAMAAALGLREQVNRPLLTTLMDHLKERHLLLVLDNCEHVVDACAELVAAFLHACPHLRILTTSRETVEVPGETAYRVPSLAMPDLAYLPSMKDLAGFAAVQLFLTRAQSRRPDFTLSAPNARAVAEVCVRLDGMPLAIELAAARVSSLPVAAIAARLDDRFRLLTGGPRTVVPRQQTLRATLDWSYDLLAEGEQRLLDRLAVFAGGCMLDAVEAVCAGAGIEDERPRESPDLPYIGKWEVLDLLGGLVNKSLVLLEEAELEGEQGRYRLLETVRQYGWERLGSRGEEAVRLRDRHLAWCLALAEEARPQLTGPEQGRWLARLEAEHDNLRAALRWCLEAGNQPAGLRLAGALGWFWSQHSHLTEGQAWLEGVLALDTPQPGDRAGALVRAQALYGAGQLAFRQDDYAWALTRFEESLALSRQAGDRQYQAHALRELGNIADAMIDWAAATRHFDQSLLLYRELGDTWGVAITLLMQGNVRRHLGDYRGAATLYEEGLVLYRALGDNWGTALCLVTLSMTFLERGAYGQASVLLEESLALYRALGDMDFQAHVLDWLALAACAAGSYDQALTRLGESLKLRRLVARWRGWLETATYLAQVAVMRGDGGRAIPLLKDCGALWQAYGWARSDAHELRWMATAARREGDVQGARGMCLECLQRCTQVHLPLTLVQALEEYALGALADGRLQEGARLCGVAAAWRDEAGVVQWTGDRAELATAVVVGRRALGEQSWQTAYAAGRALTPMQALEELLAGEVTLRMEEDGGEQVGDLPSAQSGARPLNMASRSGWTMDRAADDARTRALERVLDAAEALCVALSSERTA